MDTNVAGLNRVYCFAGSSSYNGNTVEITDGINTWTGVISELSHVFMIPSMPAPAKRRYTVNLYDSAGTTVIYTRQFELGFGDSIRIGLYQNDEPVSIGSVPLATSGRTGGVRINDNTSNGIYLDGNYITLKTATSSQKGGIQVPSSTSYGTYMSGSQLRTKYASAEQAGCIKIGEGLDIASGVAKIKAAGTSSSAKGGVYVSGGKGIELTNGEISLPELTYGSVTIQGGQVWVESNEIIDDDYTITSSSPLYNVLKRGFITDVSTDNARIVCWNKGASYRSSTSYYVRICASNSYSTQQYYESVTFYYAYFN